MSGVSNVSFQIKWGKETVTIDNFALAAGVKGLKQELFDKTNVPIDRMKVMPKSKGLWKGVLKDDIDLASACDWSDVIKKEKGGPVQLLLMGSAAALEGPKTKTVFIEDLPPEEIAKVVEPSGLVNLGNTCYLNSVVQSLRVIPQLRKCLQSYTPSSSTNTANGGGNMMLGGNAIFLASLRETYRNLDRQAVAFQPIALVQATKVAFPQFAQLNREGRPVQQDAEEFFSGLLTIAASETQGTNKGTYINASFAPQPPPTEDALMGATNVIDAIFGLKMKETLTCDEIQDEIAEPPVVSYDLHRKLICNIRGGSDGSNSASNVSYINEGIQLSLEGKIEKHSTALGRNALWTRSQRVARLSPVIVVQFQRFYWKATPDSMDHAGVKCKVMKPVAFGSDLDMYNYCCPDIQKVLKVARDKALADEEDKINQKLKGKIEAAQGDDTDVNMDDAAAVEGTTETAAAAATGEGNDEVDDDELKAALAMSMEAELPPIGPGLPANFRGIYELFAVVTHKGRDADGGHYMAWVKADHQSNAEKISDSDELNEDWYVFDDDEVSPCKTEDVLKLKGGGDWHMSYLNFYRAKK